MADDEIDDISLPSDDESENNEDAQEEEEVTDISNPAALQKYLDAGKVANVALKAIIDRVSVGETVMSLIEWGEQVRLDTFILPRERACRVQPPPSPPSKTLFRPRSARKFQFDLLKKEAMMNVWRTGKKIIFLYFPLSPISHPSLRKMSPFSVLFSVLFSFLLQSRKALAASRCFLCVKKREGTLLVGMFSGASVFR